MNYKQKYLKYKNKYLALKSQIGGILDVECPICFENYDNNNDIRKKPIALHLIHNINNNNQFYNNPAQHYICEQCYINLKIQPNGQCPFYNCTDQVIPRLYNLISSGNLDVLNPTTM